MAIASTSLNKAIRRAKETGTFALGGYQLGELPRDLANIRELREIKVINCGIETLPGWLAELDIVSLDLADNPLRGFPSVILDLVNLRQLGMSAVGIGKLPDDIGTLACLQTLTLLDCGLVSVPDSLAELTNLEELDLAFNNIGNFSHLTFPPNLTHLILSNNLLTRVPESMRGLAHSGFWSLITLA